MSQIAYTMPEAKFRSTKKRVQPVRSIRNSEFTHELKALKPQREQAAAKPKGKKSSFNLAAWWPVGVGLFLAGFAPEWQTMATQAGVWAMRFAFPLSLMAPHVGIDGATALYAQLPLDGLLTMLTLARGRSLKSAVVQLILVHGLCAFVLWLITFASN